MHPFPHRYRVHIGIRPEGEVSLDRAQTLMQGAPSCTFRYKFAPR